MHAFLFVGRARSFTPSPRRGEGGVRGLRRFRIAPSEPLIPPSPTEVGYIRLRSCLVAKSGRPDFAWGEGVKGVASLTIEICASASAKAGTHIPCLLEGLRRMGPGSSPGRTVRIDASCKLAAPG